MRIVESFPFSVREIEHEWIPLADGARLSARMWLPEGAGPVPAVIEYIPYRKRDDTRWRDEPMHGYFAGHGYASVRVDVRGAGTSDGVLEDEYSDAEWRDGLEVLRWVASQSWCDGRVGLMGKSWGGINALQIAALAPPELAGVITVCSTDDRWSTDAHWMGGCLLLENLTWGSVLQTLSMRPQDPELVGPMWRETWLRRMAEAPFYAARWLRHATRDGYWRRGSVCEEYGRIPVPVLAVSGWADAYADTVPRLLAGLPGRVRGWVGPWAHVYPHNGVPGPPAGFLQMALAWWDECLREGEGDVSEPAYRVWMNEGGGRPWEEATARGRWVCEDGWPSPRTVVRSWVLGAAREPVGTVAGAGAGDPTSRPGGSRPPLDAAGHPPGAPPGGEVATPETEAPAISVPWTGAGALAAGGWCPFGLADLPCDQAPDDRVSAVVDLPVLAERLEILGAPEVELDLSCDRPRGMVAVRLCDVAPDGTSVRVSYGLLDLAFRDGFEAPAPLDPGRRYRVRLRLRQCAWSFPRGHRLRVALSTSYWPIAEPLPEPFSLELWPGSSVLRLPERPPRPEDDALPVLPPPEAGPSPAFAVEDPPAQRREVRRDRATGELSTAVYQGWGEDGEPAPYPIEPIGLDTGWGIDECYAVRPDDPASARASIRHVVTSSRDGWSTRLEVELSQERTRSGHRIRVRVVGHEGGVEIYRRTMEEEVPG